MNERPLIQIHGVNKSFPNGRERLVVLADIDLEVGDGETVSIRGESGSGKSTLLSLIGGLDLPDSGTVRVGGRSVAAMGEDELTRYRSSTVGLVFQFHYLLRDFTTLENVMLPALLTGSRRAVARDRARALLAEVGLEARADHLPPQLSGGERQRAAAARALVNDPPVILADEPTGNLDDRNSGRVEDLLFRLVSDHGKTLLLVTHNVALASRADRALVLESGCLVRPS